MQARLQLEGSVWAEPPPTLENFAVLQGKNGGKMCILLDKRPLVNYYY